MLVKRHREFQRRMSRHWLNADAEGGEAGDGVSDDRSERGGRNPREGGDENSGSSRSRSTRQALQTIDRKSAAGGLRPKAKDKGGLPVASRGADPAGSGSNSKFEVIFCLYTYALFLQYKAEAHT